VTRPYYVGPWRVDLTVREGVVALVSGRSLARSVAAALDAAGASSPASIGLILSDDRELTELNEAHLDGEGPTDVLSFPLLQPSAYPDHPGKAADAPEAADPGDWPEADTLPGRRPHLGDIVISVERAIEQADAGRGGQTGDVRWSAADELRLLATHGALHVCGWDHADPVEETAMRSLERVLLGRDGMADGLGAAGRAAAAT
jgi:probable rRNA maturation factor